MEHIVSDEEEGRSLRDIIRNVMGISSSAMKSAKWDGRILVDGASKPVCETLHAGQKVEFIPEERQPLYRVEPFPLQLNVAFEDEYLMIIDKPAPLASQSSRNHPDDSLENAVYSYLHCPDNFIYRPVNRLDKGTSGLMAVAKDGQTQFALQKMLHTELFVREYMAVLEGIPKENEGTINVPIMKEPTSSVRRIVSPEGKPSVTHFRVLEKSNGRSLVKLRLETGRTHQIRVHMSHILCPVCGDFLYGTELPELPGRFALHSSYIRFVHPASGETVELSSPLPENLRQLLDKK